MDIINVAVTGYHGTGSSAMLDLLSEYENVAVLPEIGSSYEHVVFYYPGALFDLCNLLTYGNTPQGSDMVVNRFIDVMKRLNDNDFHWFGSYKKMFGDDFKKIVDEFVLAISKCHEGTTSYHVISSHYSPIKALAQSILSIILKKKFATKGNIYKSDHKPVYFSMPERNELTAAAQRFTKGYCELFKLNEKQNIRVFDHLIWPQQIDHTKTCFDNSFKNIVLVRDPRDLFILDKYFWHVPPLGSGKPHWGGDVDHFIWEWKKTYVPEIEDPNTLQLYFEDLVYNYEETVLKIEKFLGLDKEAHINQYKEFASERSIENTQVFLCSDKWEDEVRAIEKSLKDCLYPFPYERKPNKNLMFDMTNH